MRLVTWTAGASVVSAALIVAVDGGRNGREVLFGMFGPLAETVASWVVAEQVFRRRPERLTSVMITAFAGKLVFFGAYVTVMLGVLSLRPLPFVISFTAYFIALHLFEAFCLQRLFDDAARTFLTGAARRAKAVAVREGDR